MPNRTIPPSSHWQKKWPEDEETPEGVWTVEAVGGGSVTLAKDGDEIEVGVRRFFHRWQQIEQ